MSPCARDRREPADRAIEPGVVDVVYHAAVGVGHRGQARVVLAARHLGVGVLDLGGGGGGDGPLVRLVLGGQLPEPVEGVLDLVDDVAAGGRVERGEQVGAAGSVHKQR